MAEKSQKRQILKKRLFTKNRLVILNEDTFEEIFSLRLTLMNVFVVVSISAILIIIFTTYIIAFTTLREYIPGYASTKLRQEATELALKSDSLALALKKNDAYLKAVVKVLNGDLEYEKINKDSIMSSDNLTKTIENDAPSKAELQLREQVLQEEKTLSKDREKLKK